MIDDVTGSNVWPKRQVFISAETKKITKMKTYIVLAKSFLSFQIHDPDNHTKIHDIDYLFVFFPYFSLLFG